MATASFSPTFLLSRISFSTSPRRSNASYASLCSSASRFLFRLPPPISLCHSSKSRQLSLLCALRALIFDCDGVILESEHLHRQAYNDAFAHFHIRSPTTNLPLNWSSHFYDHLQNKIGGGKPKMRWYFKENGWPYSSIFEMPPQYDDDRAKLIDLLQGWKTERYKQIIKSGTVKPRPGILRLMDEAKASGKFLAVCSAATKSSVILCLEKLIGFERFRGLNCFLAGEDVEEKKPDPMIYLAAAKRLGVVGKECVVLEDSMIGLEAARRAGMLCAITFTSSTAGQDFKGAAAVYPDLKNISLKDLEMLVERYEEAS